MRLNVHFTDLLYQKGMFIKVVTKFDYSLVNPWKDNDIHGQLWGQLIN